MFQPFVCLYQKQQSAGELSTGRSGLPTIVLRFVVRDP
jgi:hypothetical protein